MRRYGDQGRDRRHVPVPLVGQAKYVNGAIIPVDGGSGCGDASGNALANYA
jgi:hypothetical protein